MTAPEIRRSLFLHSPAHLMPHAVLTELLAHVTANTPPAGPDGPVAVLETRIAALLGKPAALFFPSGTMAQQTALRVHAERTGRGTFAAHPHSHLDVWENQGYNAVHGLRLLRAGDRNELMTLDDLTALGEPLAAAVWELPQRDLGGLLPTWDELGEQVASVRATGAAAHMDGARLWEAQTYYERPFADIAGLFDTVYVSLYKSLLGVRGAVLAGAEDVIAQAAVWRQRLGGGIRDAWPLALAGLAGLDRHLPRMAEFKAHALAIAEAVNADGVAHTNPEPPLTPLFHVHLPAPRSAVAEAGRELLADTGVQLYGAVRSSTDPRTCSFEVTVGEHALGFTPEEVAGLVRDLVARARTHTA